MQEFLDDMSLIFDNCIRFHNYQQGNLNSHNESTSSSSGGSPCYHPLQNPLNNASTKQ